MPFLRQSSSQLIRFGPFRDVTNGDDAETGLTIDQADMILTKNGGSFAQKNASGTATHDTDGWYSTTLNDTDTNTVGILKLNVHVAGALGIWETWQVIPQLIYDALYAISAPGFLQSTTAGRKLTVSTGGLADIAAVIKKNTAFSNFPFTMFNPAGDPLAGETVTVRRSIDGGALANATGTITPVTEGLYIFSATAADTNGDTLAWHFKSDNTKETRLTILTKP